MYIHTYKDVAFYHFLTGCFQEFWRRDVLVGTTAKLHSKKSVLRFCAGSNLASGVSEIYDGENLINKA